MEFPIKSLPRVRMPRRRLVIFFWACAAALALTVAAFFGRYPPGDLAISRGVQSVDFVGVSHFSEFLYTTGVYPWFHLLWLCAAAVLFCLRHRLMAAFMLIGMLAHNFTFLIKIIVERPRPSPLVVDVVRVSDSFSFPSGHVVGAVLFWGLIALAAEQVLQARHARLLVRGGCVAMVAAMGFQRVYVGAHWPSDVLGAYLWGGVMLFVLAWSFTACRGYISRQPAPGFVNIDNSLDSR
jgi:membrane-associated phospholipid phosphatase